MADLFRRLLEDRLASIGLVILTLLAVVAVAAPWLATHPDQIYDMSPMERLQAPSASHWFGTDSMGADIYSRLLFGTRITFMTAVVAISAALVIGVPLGLLMGMGEGLISRAADRISEVFLSIPQIVLAIAIAQTLGPSLRNVILALSLTYWPWFARLVAGETRSLRKELFVKASISLGASPARVLFLHILPNL
ncbi:MAG: ABC transporter permease, partial [Hyphomicrobiaceae bacterium]